ncbi:hypothetical protein ES703_10461 [subsurface metagenome]
METFIQGAIGGVIPAVVMIIFYITSVSGRLARIETNITWLIKYFDICPPHSKDPSQ